MMDTNPNEEEIGIARTWAAEHIDMVGSVEWASHSMTYARGLAYRRAEVERLREALADISTTNEGKAYMRRRALDGLLDESEASELLSSGVIDG